MKHSLQIILGMALLTLCIFVNNGWCAAPQVNQKNPIPALEKRAENGDTEAQALLGLEYGSKYHVDDNGELAVQWLSKAAAGGNSEAQIDLAEIYLEGEVVPKNPTRAVEILSAAAESGHKEALEILVHLYLAEDEEEQIIPRDVEKAIFWTEKWAVSQGTEALKELAWAYQDGEEYFPKDAQRALYWYREAAKSGSVEDKLELAKSLLAGDGFPVDIQEAVHWYVEAWRINQNSIDSFFRNLNQMENAKLVEQMIYLLRKASEQELDKLQQKLTLMTTYAAYVLGDNYLSKYHFKEKNPQRALHWFEQSIAWGNEMIDDHPTFLGQDSEYLKILAQQKFELGLLNYEGDKIPQDKKTGLAWIKKAAISGHQDAIDFLAQNRAHGQITSFPNSVLFPGKNLISLTAREGSIEIGNKSLTITKVRGKLADTGKVIFAENKQFASMPGLGYVLFEDATPFGTRSSWFVQYNNRTSNVVQVYTILPENSQAGYTFDTLFELCKKTYGDFAKGGLTPKGKRYALWYDDEKDGMLQILQYPSGKEFELKIMYKNRPNLREYKSGIAN